MSIGHYNDSVDRPIDPLDRLLRRRVVMLSGAVTGEMAQDVMARLLYLGPRTPTPRSRCASTRRAAT